MDSTSTAHVVWTIGRRLSALLLIVAFYCTGAGLLAWWWDVRLVVGGSAASAISTLILGLLMTFRNRVAYDRWWEARGLWGQLTNDCRNLALKLAAFVPAEELARAKTAPTMIAFAQALKRHLREGAVRLQDLPDFRDEQAAPAHVPLYLAGRLYDALAAWRRAGYIDGAALWMCDAHLRGWMDVCGACEKIRHTPPAPSYRALLRTGLLLNVLAEPWLTVPDAGFWSVPVFLLVCFFLLGLELIDSVVEEPFGPERDDLDLDRYCRTIRDSVQAILPSAEPLDPARQLDGVPSIHDDHIGRANL